jgi:hypothetical protein
MVFIGNMPLRNARKSPPKLALQHLPWLFRQHAAWLVLLLLATGPVGAVEVPWLYDVEVPVENQSTPARLDAAGRALAELLTRITGLASVPRNEAVSRALAAPDLYYNQFRFERARSEPGQDDDGLQLRLQFVPEVVLDLVRDAKLPIWRANRPTVMVWIVVDDGLVRSILGADSVHPVVTAITARARERGVPVRLPLLDLTDQLTVEPAAVWGRLSQILEPASERYGADAILVGRLQQRPDEPSAVSWELWVDGDIRHLEQEAREPAPLGRAAADLVADELAGRYAVLDRGVRRLDLAVSAVAGAADYADLLRYFGDLEFVEEVIISAVSGDRLEMSLITAAGPDQLLELFRLDQRLLPDPSTLMPGPPIELVWQGRSP